MPVFYKPLTDLQKADLNEMISHTKFLWKFISKMGNSRELSLAKTKLEEMELWLQEHIVKNGSGISK